MRLSIISTFLVLSTIGCARAAATPDQRLCEVVATDPRMVVLNAAGKTVTLVGWEHLDDSSKSILSGFHSAFSSATAGKCDRAKVMISDALRDHADEYFKARTLFDRIEASYAGGSLNVIGVEMSEEELAMQRELNVKNGRDFDEMSARCDLEFKQEVEKLRLVITGPEFYFERLHPEISLKPIEDGAIKAATVSSFDGGDQETFDFENPAMTEEARTALAQIERDLMNQEAPSEARIQQAVSFEKDPSLRAKLEDGLRFSIARGQKIIAGAYLRNVSIAKTILDGTGNTVVPLGFRHVEHLTGEILRQCKSR